MSELHTVQSEPTPEHSPARHEPKDVNVRGILIAVACLGVLLLATHLASVWSFDHLLAREQAGKRSVFPLAAAERGRLPPEPRLEQIDRLRGTNLRVEEQPRLDSYGWVDEKAGIARIPVERAMKILVEQKLLPSRPGEPRPPERPSGASSGRTPREKKP
jgi:hypothetical protein